MSESRPRYGKQVKRRAPMPRTPPPSEQQVRGVEPGKAVCPICRRTFDSKEQLDKHTSKKHPGEPSPIS